MSDIALTSVKRYLRVFHSADDLLLQDLLDGAEEEAKRFTNRTQLPTLPVDYPPEFDSSSSEIPEDVPSSEDPVPFDVFCAVCLFVKADYEATTPDEIAGYRKAAETKLWPYRAALGV